MPQSKTLIVILGPTAVGKTSFAIEVAQHFKTEIISADSRQFFKELNIGVARPSLAELEAVPHHFIGFLSVSEHYNAGKYANEALVLVDTLFRDHNIVICAGGSMMYIDALLNGFDELPSDLELKKQLTQLHKDGGIEVLQSHLQALDPDYFDEVDQKNPHRLIRAIEVCRLTGKPYSELRSGIDAKRPFKIIKLGLTAQRNHLYKQINVRVDLMMQQGFLEEAKSLCNQRHLQALNTVGYKELFACIAGECTLDEAVDKIKQHTRNFAKRQLTWWRRDNDIHWLDVTEKKPAVDFVLPLLT